MAFRRLVGVGRAAKARASARPSRNEATLPCVARGGLQSADRVMSTISARRFAESSGFSLARRCAIDRLWHAAQRTATKSLAFSSRTAPTDLLGVGGGGATSGSAARRRQRGDRGSFRDRPPTAASEFARGAQRVAEAVVGDQLLVSTHNVARGPRRRVAGDRRAASRNPATPARPCRPCAAARIRSREGSPVARAAGSLSDPRRQMSRVRVPGAA